MYILKYLLFNIFLLLQIVSFSQTKDSLLHVLATKQTDSLRINTLNELVSGVYLSNPDTAILICEEMLSLSKKNNLKNSTAESYGWLAYLYGSSGNNEKALEYNLKAVEILKNTDLKESLANVYINIATIYSHRGDSKKSLNYYNKSLVIQRESNNKKSLGITYNNMAYVYDNIGDTEKAIEYWNKGLEIQIEINDKKGIATSYNNLGVVFSEHNDLDKAYELYLKSLKLYKEINDIGGEGNALKMIGNFYMQKKDYVNAKKYFEESLSIFNKIGRVPKIAELYLDLSEIYKIKQDFITAHKYAQKSLAYYSNSDEKAGLVEANNTLAGIYLMQKKYSKALFYAKKSFELSNYLKYPAEIEHSANQLKNIYLKFKNYKDAIKYYDIEVKMHDSITNNKIYKSLIKEQIKYSFQKQLDVKNAELKNSKLENSLKQKQRVFYIIISIFLTALLLVLFLLFLQKTKANKKLIYQSKLLNNKSNELQKANQQIEKSEKKFKTLFEDSGDAVLILENDCIIDCNKSMLKLFGYDNKKDFLRLHPSEISPEFQEDKRVSFEKANAMIKQAIENKTNRFEWIHKKKNNETFYAEVLLTLISLENDKQIIHSVVRDISERIKIEKDLKIAIKEAKAANKLKSEFLANMSHEIRTPMNAILGFSSILHDRLTNEKEKSFINKITTSGNNLLELINDILDFSKIEVGQLKIQKERANIADIINEVPLIFSQISKQKSIPVKIEINDNIPPYLNIDVLRIKQIILNLVSNALKFTEKGFVSIIVNSIQINNYKEAGKINLQIIVKDTGIGIPDSQINYIFESFRQVDGQSNRKFGGAGLGLAITKKLVELMDGTILVNSKVNEGTQFIIQLNNIEVLTNDTILINDNNQIKLQKTKILHVENDLFNREIISLYFEDEDVELKEAINRKEVFDVLKSFKPDLILMDIKLNNESGFEITKEIKQIDKFKNIPVFAITANATSEDLQKYSYIFDEYLTKPLYKDDLFKIIDKYVALNKKNNNLKYDNDFVNQIKEEIKKAFTQEFKTNFSERIIPLFNKIEDVLLIDDLKLFVKEICILSNKYKIEGLKNYCKLLQMSTENFNITNIKKLLAQFTEIVKIINEK